MLHFFLQGADLVVIRVFWWTFVPLFSEADMHDSMPPILHLIGGLWVQHPTVPSFVTYSLILQEHNLPSWVADISGSLHVWSWSYLLVVKGDREKWLASVLEYSTVSSLDPLELKAGRQGWKVWTYGVLLSQEIRDLHCSYIVDSS